MSKLMGNLCGLSIAIMLSMSTAGAATIVIDLGGGSATYSTGITQNGAGTSIIYNHYEVGAGTAPDYNPLAGTPNPLKDTGGIATTYGFIRSGAAIGSSTPGAATLTTGAGANNNASQLFPDAIGNSFGFVSGVSASASWVLYNLDANTNYTFDILSARAAGTTRNSSFTVAGLTTPASQTINSSNNTSSLLHFDNVQADANGKITITLTEASPNDANFGYINGIQIVSSPVPEPATLGILGLGSMTLLIRRRHT